MEHSDLMVELEELNLAYLMLAQRLLHADRVSAMFRLKIDEETAGLLLSLSSRQLARLARTNQLLCHFGLDGAERLRQVVDNPRDQGMGGFHASLLMSSRSAAAPANGKGS